MYDEPYRWVEAVGNRRQYLDDQFRQGSPVVAVAYAEGIVLVTVSQGTPKLYEIYDRIGLGGMGHPADLEKLRFSLLDMAHMEGFQRSPADVTGSRLVKYGLAPVIKQAFEEIFKAPYIAKLLLAELGTQPHNDRFFTVDYDGTFEQHTGYALLGATPTVQQTMCKYLTSHTEVTTPTLSSVLETALRTWGIGSLHQQEDPSNAENSSEPSESSTSSMESFSDEKVLQHIQQTMSEKTLECSVLERQAPGSSKYRALKPEEVASLLPILKQTTKS